MADATTVFHQLAIALGLGLLVGLQRQRTNALIGGIRTFPLITVLGALCAHLSFAFSGHLLGLGLLALTALLVSANLIAFQQKQELDAGQTSEVAMLLMYGVGALLVVGPMPVAVALGGGVAVLLHLKDSLHRLAGHTTDADFRAIIQFVLISLVILPVLPDRAFGPYGVLNPREIWWMVVLIVGLGLAGYLAYKRFGAGAGTVLAGILGGLISSTATTASYARGSRSSPEKMRMATLVILLAGTVVFVRVFVELAVVVPQLLGQLGWPLAVMVVGMAVASLLVGWHDRPHGSTVIDPSNPSELRSAMLFAGLYALVLLAVAAVREHFGEHALYGLAALSGLTDVDALALSTAKLMRDQGLPTATGWRLILVAALANLGFKFVLIAGFGGRPLARCLALPFAAMLALGSLLLALWPQTPA